MLVSAVARPSEAMVNPADPPPPRLTPAAFAERFDNSSKTLWCVAVAALGDRANAEDLVQDAAMIALQKLDDFDPDTNFTAWMARIVRNLALNAVRRKVRRRTHAAGDLLEGEAANAEPATTSAAPIDSRGGLHGHQNSFDDDVARALRDLDDTARACLLLRTVQGLPYDEISLALDIPAGTAMSHVHRARKAMRAKLCETSRPAAADAPGKGAPTP